MLSARPHITHTRLIAGFYDLFFSVVLLSSLITLKPGKRVRVIRNITLSARIM